MIRYIIIVLVILIELIVVDNGVFAFQIFQFLQK